VWLHLVRDDARCVRDGVRRVRGDRDYGHDRGSTLLLGVCVCENFAIAHLN
jgi:hypothetical protein